VTTAACDAPPRPARPPVKLPRDDGAWYMAGTCWIVGWAAAHALAWEPLLLAAGTVALFAAAQSLRTVRRLWVHDRPAAHRALMPVAPMLLVPVAALAVLVRRAPDQAWIAAIAMPAMIYAPIVLAGEERLPIARVLAVVALTGLAPATYAAASGRFGATALVLWAALGGYFILGALFVIARLRRTSSSGIALALVRVATPAAAAAMAAWAGHLVLAVPFALLALRAWIFRAPPEPTDPRRIGRAELVHSLAAAALVLAGVWLR
jgi:hypothetical protein